MRFIPTKVHAIIDYVLGLLMIALPWILGFSAGGAATWAFVALGAVVIVYSLLTNYEYGAMRAIPMRVHVWLDIVAGLLLAIAPWAFTFASTVLWPHVIIGALLLLFGIFSKTVPTLKPVTTGTPHHPAPQH
ncbi:MAG: hypothetical protein E1N59_915 [Puniceicoccaceae bacterium 5H]|nr:MAG: hypothetical protein E1N59_915 [Puniceicoccaceae bacterium 5H]